MKVEYNIHNHSRGCVYFVAVNRRTQRANSMYKIVCSRGKILCINLPLPKESLLAKLRKIARGVPNGMEKKLEDHCSIVDSMVIVTPILPRYTSNSRVSRIKSDKCDSVLYLVSPLLTLGIIVPHNTIIRREE